MHSTKSMIIVIFTFISQNFRFDTYILNTADKMTADYMTNLEQKYIIYTHQYNTGKGYTKKRRRYFLFATSCNMFQ